MEVHVLGSYPRECSHRYILSSTVINGEIAIDAGCLALGLTVEEQRQIRHILLTHTHIDHIATLPLFIDNRLGDGHPPPSIFSAPHNIAMLKKHIFNNTIWPDLLSISHDFFTMIDVEPAEEVELPGYSFHFFPVNHPVPTYGIVLEEKKTRHQVLFTSDTTICDVIWMEANRCKRLKGIFIEISFPDSLKDLAHSSGHLTPSLLEAELRKLKKPAPVYLTHYKSQYIEEIRRELEAFRGIDLHICMAGEKIRLD